MRATILSPRSQLRHPSMCHQYECEDVLRDLLDGELYLLPGRDPASPPRGTLRDRLRRRRPPPQTAPVLVRDLMLVVCQSLSSVPVVGRVPDWRTGSRFAVCWIHELFPTETLNPDATNLLDQFDLVILNFESPIEKLRQAAPKANIVHMPLGIDALKFCPFPDPPQRSLDLYWLGRSDGALHGALQGLAERENLLYVFNSAFMKEVASPHEHRLLVRRFLKRTRLFLAYPAKFNEPAVTADHEEAGFRYWEGAAAGAALVGHRPRTPAFDTDFPYEDAVIELPKDPDAVPAFVMDLLTQTDRLDRIARSSVRHSLLHHDWAHRLAAVLEQLGLSDGPAEAAIAARRHQLEALAAKIDG